MASKLAFVSSNLTLKKRNEEFEFQINHRQSGHIRFNEELNKLKNDFDSQLDYRVKVLDDHFKQMSTRISKSSTNDVTDKLLASLDSKISAQVSASIKNLKL